MAHLFADDPTVGGDANFELGMQPFDFVTEANFQDRVDLSVPGMMQDCAECHVGGGAMEYVPALNLADRVSLRDFYTDPFNHLTTPQTFTSANYTPFNYFIDTFDVDNDGDLLEVQEADFAQLGVIEMDCFLCHLKDYDYVGRRDMQRAAKFDASRAVGAGVAAQNNVGFGTAGYGTEVYYNDLVVSDGTNLSFGSTIIANLKASPPSDNCAFCHFNHGAVDWKKRGDNWKNDSTYDVHTVLGCMGCHEGKVGSAIGTTGDPSSSALGQCDPTRGQAPYSSIWGATKGTVKTCADCHLKAGWDADLGEYSNDFGAPDPTARHQALGFTAQICQTDADGNVNASHLDILECTVCHVRKASTESWNTGGAVVDATGADVDGRLADHENQYVHRAMYDGGTDTTNISYAWHRGKVYSASVLTTLFWRDKNPAIDINGDDQLDGMDALLMTDVLATNLANGWTNMVEDNHGVVDSTVIGDRITELNADLDSKWGVSGSNNLLSSLAVAFKVNHNVSPASYALGHACADCHSPGAFFDRDYALHGDAMDLTFDPAQVTPFTKLGGTDPTDFHPNLKNRDATASIQLRALHYPVGYEGEVTNDTLREIKTGEMLYPATVGYIGEDTNPYTTRAAWVGYLTSAIGDGTGHGIGVQPTASITTNLSSPYVVGADVDLTAANSAAPGSQYYWNVQDQPGTLTGQGPITYTLNNPGTYQVLLTVVSPQGNLAQQVGSITVARQVAATTGAVSNVVGSTVTLTLSNLPALADYDQLYVRYGDGTWETVAADGFDDNTQVVVRDYRLRPTYFDGTSYNYVTTVQVKNGGVVVETAKFPVVITP